MILVAAGFQLSIWISALERMRFTKDELPGVSETLGNTDSCITTSVSIRAVVKPVFEISMSLVSRRFLFMLTQYLKMSMTSSLFAVEY